MFSDLIDQFRQTYQNKYLTLSEFSNILDQYARLDIRCDLDDNVKEQLYKFIKEKQQNVTYCALETVIIEFLLQQDVIQPKSQINLDSLGKCARKLPLDMLQSITNDFLLQFKNFYKLVANKYVSIVDYRELERLGKELQRTIKINSLEILRFIQPLVDNQSKVKIDEILELSNDLEKLLYEQNRRQSKGPETKRPIALDQSADDNHYTSEDENLKQNNFISNASIERKNLTNLIYQQTDLIKQKFINKAGLPCLSEINKTTQCIEALIANLIKEVDVKTKKIEELIIEKELTSGSLQQFEIEIQNKDQQIQLCLQDNDMFQSQINQILDQNKELKIQLNVYNEELKSITRLETELKEMQIENKNNKDQLIKMNKENSRLQLNNKSLMGIIEELESKSLQNKDVDILKKSLEQHKEQINELEIKVDDLQIQIQQLEDLNQDYEKAKEGLEQQIIELKRELTYYKKMLENTNIENQQLRNSFMPRTSILNSQQMNGGGFGRLSKMSIGGGLTSSKIFIIGRNSSQRVSSIRGNQQAMYGSNFNPLEEIQSVPLKIEEAQDLDDQNPDQQNNNNKQIQIQSRIGARINLKYENSIVEAIKEENEDKEQVFTVSQKPQENQLLQQFDKFLGELGTKNLEELATDSQCIKIDENILYYRDFLGIRDDPKALEYLKLEKNIYKQIIQRCFSDGVYRIDAKGKKARRILFLTEHTFYIFEGEKKPGKLSRSFPLKNIHTLIFSEASPVICCIKVAGSDDYLIETFKRSELNSFLTEIFASYKIPLFQVEFISQFKIKFKGVKDEIPISQVIKKQTNQDQGTTPTYKVSSKQGLYSQNMGWLQIFKKKMFQGDWQEVFVILTNVGLVLFKKPGDAEPILFISFVEAIVIKNPSFETSKQYIIKIRYENCDSEFVFNATSAILLDQWHDAIQNAIIEQVKQKLQYMVHQQKQVVDHRTQTMMDQSESQNHNNKLS
ncbi:unnamed protein product [Paramecium sonneborni]|uniref:PH domain-containing protein n=1 Tax=Paramecium sonneborni TaxID=65129 RepID=A0A8S1Q135_9CILI|nr:unnamed protein product [Paramecium sonneborni]